MAAPIENCSDSSSSEDEEENAKFKEVLIGFTILKQDQTKSDSHQQSEKDKRHVPSKRPDKEVSDTDQFDNAYNTTPGFRKHMSRKLSEALDSVIDCSGQYFGAIDNADDTSGVKLFSSSKLDIQVNSYTGESVKPVNKRCVSSSSDNSSEDERLAEASVSHDFVLQQSNIPYLTNQKAADIIINQAEAPAVTNKNNNQADSSRNDTKIKHNGSANEKSKIDNVHKHEKTKIDNVHKQDEIMDESIKKHKKKKKKKHKKGVD